jgi:CO/xanthine dehydrogenase Mo-binding subunit
LPPVIGLDAARKQGAPVVFEKSSRKKAGNVSEGAPAPAAWNGNLRGPSAAFSSRAGKARSWVAQARAAKDPLLVEETFRTGTQSHACLEPHATLARFDGDRLIVHASTQSVFHVMELLAKRYKLKHENIRVIADHVGGGFGSKGTLGVETTVAIDLAREAKAPVRIAYDRHEELSVTGYRPAAELKIALLPSAQGAVAGCACRYRHFGEFDHRGIGAADLSGGGKGARRLRRRQQPAAGRAVPRPRRTADGLCARTGDRRSRASHEGRSDRFAQTLGSQSQSPAAV